LPPAGSPERLPPDVLDLVARALQGGTVHFQNVAPGVQEGDKLVHAIQDDCCSPLMFLDLVASLV
jgi:hypothetical protein